MLRYDVHRFDRIVIARTSVAPAGFVEAVTTLLPSLTSRISCVGAHATLAGRDAVGSRTLVKLCRRPLYVSAKRVDCARSLTLHLQEFSDAEAEEVRGPVSGTNKRSATVAKTPQHANERALINPVETSSAPVEAGTGKRAFKSLQALSLWEYLWPRGLLVLVAAIWGTNFATVKFIGDADSLDVSAGAFVRFGIAAIAMAPFTWRAVQRLLDDKTPTSEHGSDANAAPQPEVAGTEDPSATVEQRLRKRTSEFLFGVLGLGTVVFTGYFTQAIGLLGTDANKSAFLCSLTVVLVPFMERTFLGKRIEPRAWMSAFLATIGVGLLELDGSASVSLSDLWSFLQAVCFGAGFMIVEKLTRRFPGHPLEIAALNLTIVAVYSGLWCLSAAFVSGTTMQDLLQSLAQILIDHGSGVAGALLYTGLVTTALAVMMQTVAISKVSAEEAAVIFCLEPLFAVAFSAALLGESMSMKGASGGALILLAVLCNQALNPEMRSRLGLQRSRTRNIRAIEGHTRTLAPSDRTPSVIAPMKPRMVSPATPEQFVNGTAPESASSSSTLLEKPQQPRTRPRPSILPNEITFIASKDKNSASTASQAEDTRSDESEMASVHS
jgi:drug/metabolite transporter (DMT)-like permease